ncbi:MAG: glyoxalase/bleomycin resistance/extradiol dioxygenase family protein [Gammaproteobacteria bacterium]|nr:glyoxalase/bleomycin resistance/extradiol dioxygenase family protein [Gammaproteobacteria bacterium]|tara:strand:- start:1644 stop:2069 length:426 start_codon:yes stop_codon:yes gene_type:complete
MRLQLALNVADLDQAVAYYGGILGAPVNRREPGYANFVIDEPALKLVLFENASEERLNHVGFEVFSDAQVDSAGNRLAEAGLDHEAQNEETCCYAKQNKVVSFDPQGLMWEWYRVIEDSPSFFAEPEGAEPVGCCAGQCSA